MTKRGIVWGGLIVFLCATMLASIVTVSAAKVELEFWRAGEKAVAEVMAELIQKFEKEYPDIKINYVPMPGFSWEERATKVRLAFASGTQPDLLQFPDVDLAPFVGKGLTLAAPPEIEKFLDENMAPEYLIHARWGKPEGPVIVIPYGNSFTQIWYNAQMLKKAGLFGPAKTWEEFVNYGKKLTIRSSDGEIEKPGFSITTRGSGQDFNWDYVPWFLCTGQKEISRDGKRTLFNTEEGRRWLQFMLDLVTKHQVLSLALGAVDRKEQFANGETAMSEFSLWYGGWLRSYAPQLKMGVDIFPGTIPKDKISASLGGTRDMAVLSGTEHEKEAWLWVEFFFRPENLAPFNAAFNELPTTRAASESPLIQNHAALSIHKEQFSVQRPLGEGASEFSHTVGQYVERAMYQDMTIDEALKKLDEELAKLQEEKTIVNLQWL